MRRTIVRYPRPSLPRKAVQPYFIALAMVVPASLPAMLEVRLVAKRRAKAMVTKSKRVEKGRERAKRNKSI
jgi:hypothetical protein